MKKPEIHVLLQNQSVKILSVKGDTETELATHIADKDVAVICRKGSCVFTIGTETDHVHDGLSFTIEAGTPHHVKGSSDFEFLLIMPADTKMQFLK
ncbi:MAG: hypothetical protein Fur0041_15030 [Bacteroidia bacterium]